MYRSMSFFVNVAIFEYIKSRKQRNYHILESNRSKETNEPILDTPEYELLKYTMYGCDNDMKTLQKNQDVLMGNQYLELCYIG